MPSIAPSNRAKPVAERGFDSAGMRGERQIDGVVVRGRGGFELSQTLGGFRRQLLEVVRETLVEVFATGLHHHVDGVEMAGDARIELVGMSRDPVDDAVAVFADQIVERFHIFAHAPRLLRQGLDQAAAALADDGVERRHLRAEARHACCCALAATVAAASLASAAKRWR